MKFREMRANFGKLNNETLTLHDGLNVISMPNEGGKSTWCDFITAMLYGVPTRPRSSDDRLQMKDKYAPWNGSPMSGSAEVEHEGNILTLERTAKPRQIVMTEFRAMYPGGAEYPGLTGDNCGKTLTGAKQELFERSAFLRQQGAKVDSSAELEQRLTALVSSGEEAYSYSGITKKLNDLSNRIMSNRANGRLPELTAAKSAAEDNLQKTHDVQELLARKSAELMNAEAEAAELNRKLAVLDAVERRGNQEKAAKAEREAEEAEQNAARLSAECAALPDAASLKTLSESSIALQSRLDSSRAAAARPVSLPEKPDTPDVFAGLTPEQALEKAGKDAAECRELTATRQPPAKAGSLPGLLLILAGLLAGAVLALAVSPLFALLGLLPAATGAVLLLLRSGRNARQQAEFAKEETGRRHRAETLLARYNADSPEQLPLIAENWKDDTAEYERRRSAAESEAAGLKQSLDEAEAETRGMLRDAEPFAGKCDSLEALRSSLNEIQAKLSNAEKAENDARLLRGKADTLRSVTGALQNISAADEEEAKGLDRGAIQRRLDGLDISALQTECANLQGRLDSITDPLEESARIEAYQAEIAELQRKKAALENAMTVLGSANDERQARFSPQLCERAGRNLSRLTNGACAEIRISREFIIQVRPAASAEFRPILQFSGGTMDQVYLAVRLALCDLLLPGAPIVLDEALAEFDNERCRLALRVLKQMSESRQILLFTCHTRESEMLEALLREEQEDAETDVPAAAAP